MAAGPPPRKRQRITPLDAFLESYAECGTIVHRPLVGAAARLCVSQERLRTVHDVVYDRPYDLDPADWVAAALHPRSAADRRTDKRFWCSAFVGYLYVQCGVLAPSTQWTTMRPCDFDVTSRDLQYVCAESARLSDSVAALPAPRR